MSAPLTADLPKKSSCNVMPGGSLLDRFSDYVQNRRLTALRAGRARRFRRQNIVKTTVRLGRRALEVHLRPGTIDAELARLILRADGEYQLPDVVRPRVIVDIGANIGLTALYFAACYPDADIYCFEPLPQNVELLERNARANSDRIRVIPAGVSDVEGNFEYFMSDDPRNFGGGGFMTDGNDSSRRVVLPLITAEQALARCGVSEVDVFKIDTEGSELPILRAIPQHIRCGAQAYIGELHGEGDWEFCRLLSESHAVGVRKKWQTRCFPFVAVRNGLI